MKPSHHLDDVHLPAGRTEREIAAEVVARLIEARHLRFQPRVLAEVARTLGIKISDIRRAVDLRAWVRQPFDSDQSIRDGEPLPVVPELPRPPDPPVAVPKQLSAWNGKQRAKKEPKPGVRICTRCGPQPKTAFATKNKRTGALRSMCMDCMSSHQAERYLSIEKMRKLGPVLRFVLAEGDAIVGSVCSTCSKRCKVGQTIVAMESVFHHSDHFGSK